MKLSPQKFTSEDFKSEVSWIGKLIAPLNNLIENIYTLSQNNITIDDNLFQEIKEIRFENTTSNFPIKFQTKFSNLPKAVICVFCVATDGTTSSGQPWPTWVYGNSQIQINSLTGLTPNLIYTIRIHVIYN
jgi:hypothetical protein